VSTGSIQQRRVFVVTRPWVRVALCVAMCVALCGCAWSNRANRPVWNAFEANLVPDDDTAFYATLPLTVPAGLGAVLLDTFIVHPAQVADDAWGDAGELWDNMDWRGEYYTELATLPFRAVGTPLVFLVMFLARSAFDIPPRATDGEHVPPVAANSPGAAPHEAAEAADAATAEPRHTREQQLLERLQAMATGEPGPKAAWLEDLVAPTRWTPALDAACEAALAHGNAYARWQLYAFLRRGELPPWQRDPVAGLRDPDPVVRFNELNHLPDGVEVPPELRAQLRDDPVDSVRVLARWRLK